MHSAAYREVLTTGQVAKICSVVPRTVRKWCDSGALPSFSVPGSDHRRIQRTALLSFLRDNDMLLQKLEEEALARILLVTRSRTLAQKLVTALARYKDARVTVAGNSFEAGLLMKEVGPQCVAVDFADDSDRAQHFCQTLRKKSAYSAVTTVAVLPKKDRQLKVDSSSITEVFQRPCDLALLAERLYTLSSPRQDTSIF